MKARNPNNEPYLKVFKDKSVLFDGKITQVFEEGKQSTETIERLKKIRKAFEDGFLPNVIKECKEPEIKIELDQRYRELLEELVEFTSEVGRALVGLTILQLCIKCIEPAQSIRLHKGGRAGGASFSWKDGIPMRVLDKNFITPALKEYDLLRLNADGIMMTRSLAENYPYSQLYKAAIRGARSAWLEIVDLLERNEINPHAALRYLIILLFNKSSKFHKMSDEAWELTKKYIDQEPSLGDIIHFIKKYVDESSYSARIFEVSLHSLYQVLDSYNILPGTLKPLTQMRSANKKHGNIGDIEVINSVNPSTIIESWDAKYGKKYLRDELEELAEKLEYHPETEVAGFVVNEQPDLKPEIKDKIEEISYITETEIKIYEFNEWVFYQIKRINENVHTPINENDIAKDWLMAFIESLGQKRRHIAPIDEPCDQWISDYITFIKACTSTT